MKMEVEAGIPVRITATGTAVIGSSGMLSIGLLGINVGSMTAPTVGIYHGRAVAAAGTILAAVTCAANGFTRIPAICSGGSTITVTGVDSTVDLTIYWNPLA